MLKIRFLRTGKKNQPFFRIVVCDKKNPPTGGRFLEVLGFLNPFTKEKNVKEERIRYWLSKGAQPSDRVHNLLVQQGVLKEPKIPAHKLSKKKPSSAEKAVVGKEEPKEEEAKPETKPEIKSEKKPEEAVKTEKSEEKKEEEPKTE